MLTMKNTLYFLLMTLLSVMAQAADAYRSPGLTPLELESRLDTPEVPLVVDLLSPAEFGIGHVPGAINIPLPELEKRIDEIRNDNGMVL